MQLDDRPLSLRDFAMKNLFIYYYFGITILNYS